MKQKLIFILKCIFLTLIVFNVFNSCSNAWTYDDFCDFVNDHINDEPNANFRVAIQNFYNNRNWVKSWCSSNGINLDEYDNFFLSGNVSGFQKFQFFIVKGNFSYSADNSSTWLTVNSSNACKQIYQVNGGGANYITSTNHNSSFGTNAKAFGLFTTEPTNGFVNGVILQNYFTPPFEFVPTYDNKINLGHRNGINCLIRSYSVASWRLGTITETGDFDYISVSIGAPEWSDRETATYSHTVDSNFNDVSGDRNIVLLPNGQIDINSRLFYYETPYLMDIKVVNGSEVNWYYYLYYFVPYGSIVVSSGDSGDVVSVGDDDYSVQNSTNDIISSVVDTDNIHIDSGDFFSLFSVPDVNMGYTFLQDLWMNIYNLFMCDDEVTLTLGTPHIGTVTIYTGDLDFPIQDEELRSFVRLAWWFLIGYAIYCHIDEIVEYFNIGSPDEALKSLYASRRLF